MSTDKLHIKCGIQIAKPTHEVFDAIVKWERMKNYFISESTGDMEEGKERVWKWPEFDVESSVRVGKIEKDRYISYYWGEPKNEQLVEMNLQPEGDTTVITITEKEMDNNEAGLKWLMGNTEGWANFLNCLKAYLEYGINLRKGAFDYRKKEWKNDSYRFIYFSLFCCGHPFTRPV